MTKKELVQNASQIMLSMTDGPVIISNASAAGNVASDLFGNAPMLRNKRNSPGLNYGSRKAILLDDSLSFLAIAHSKSNKSKTIGSTNSLSKTLISQKSHTSFTMALTLDELTALFQS